ALASLLLIDRNELQRDVVFLRKGDDLAIADKLAADLHHLGLAARQREKKSRQTDRREGSSHESISEGSRASRRGEAPRSADRWLVVRDVRSDLVAVVHGTQLPPVLLRDGVLDPVDRAVAHGDVDAAGVPAARGRLLERTGLPGAHAAAGIIDRPLAIIGVVV